MSREQTNSTRVEALQPLPQWEASPSVNGSSTGGASEQDRIVTHPADALARARLKGPAGVPQAASARAEMTGSWINYHPTTHS